LRGWGFASGHLRLGPRIDHPAVARLPHNRWRRTLDPGATIGWADGSGRHESHCARNLAPHQSHSTGYSGADEHAQTHQGLIDRAGELVANFTSGELALGDLFNFLAYDVVAIRTWGQSGRSIQAVRSIPCSGCPRRLFLRGRFGLSSSGITGRGDPGQCHQVSRYR
jgi:hypothetical protein